MHPKIKQVTERITARSKKTRETYLKKIGQAESSGPARGCLSCSNLAHAMAASDDTTKARLSTDKTANLAIVSAYNDMLSAHQPLESYPALIKKTASELGASAQFAGGVPAMCDGVTQGQDGMDLSLFSRDVIALSTAVALTHNVFDAAVCLGVCDKIVPGLLIGALSFGHLPVAFIPAGPMTSGLSNPEKAKVREQFAAGKIGREELLAAESKSYHGPGTCTFYGTANSNQMMLEFMGLQPPGGSFVNPNTPLRDALTAFTVETVLGQTEISGNYLPMGRIVNEKAIVNATIGLMATGGSTNHSIHLIAIASAAGIQLNWDDMAELSHVVPLLARVYPNGIADVNHFHAAGGLGFVMGELLNAGLLHQDVHTIVGEGLDHYCQEPFMVDEGIEWRPAKAKSLDESILSACDKPFDAEGGLRLVQGNLGRAIVKVSAVDEKYYAIQAPAKVFHSQDAFAEAFKAGKLQQDFVAVLPYQGAAANGMPELHKLTPYLSLLQKQGFKVALLTDGRMSGASGQVLAAIQTSPEALNGGLLAKVIDDDVITIDAETGMLEVSAADDVMSRPLQHPDISSSHVGLGRELFSAFRKQVEGAEQGASIFSSGNPI